MTWLAGFIQHCDSQLSDISKSLLALKNHCETAADNYYKTGVHLVQANQFSGGQGAPAFLSELNTDINTYRVVLDGIGHVSSGAQTCSDTIKSSTATYDGLLQNISPIPGGTEAQYFSDVEFDIWRDDLINETLSNAGSSLKDSLNLVLAVGSSALIASFNAAKQKIQSAASQYAENTIMSAESQSSDPVAYQHSEGYYFQYEGGDQAFRIYCTNVAADLAKNVWNYLSTWADDIGGAAISFLITIQDSESYLSARDLFDFIYSPVDGTQSTNKPITITPYTNNEGQTCLLITVGGTDNSHSWDDGLNTAINTGMNYPSAYLPDVENAITQYMKEHPNMQGAQVTFAGYSLGGMTVENLVDYHSSFFNQYNLHVTNVITYGSPVMGPPQPGVNYQMYDATGDPIPLLSYYENPELGNGPTSNPYQQPNFSAAAGLITGAQYASWDKKLHNYIDTKGEYTGYITPITDVGTDPSKLLDNHMHYYQSNQLNGSNTSIDINPATLGPTEYFSMQDS